MKKNKAYFITIAVVVALGFAALPSAAQSVSSGVVKTIGSDGTLLIGAGQNAGFEPGDVLVIQRNGTKIGLVHVDSVDETSSEATIMKTEQNNSVKVGDVVAYQLMSGGSAGYSQFPAYSANVETEQPPNIMKREWLTQQTPATDYDTVINKQTAALSKNAHDRSAMIRLADAYFKKGWYIHSVKWNQRAIEEKPNAPENDKLLAQIIRSYGYLNDPEKQRLYMDYLTKHYPTSVFVSMTGKEISSPAESTIPYWKKDVGPITDASGFQKGGMRIMQKGASEIKTPGETMDVGGKLLHGNPERMAPGAPESAQ
jgi:hypothetical protein